MKAALQIVLGLALVACGGDEGDDSLPKRGDNPSDPTIVSATANCGSEVGSPGTPAVMELSVNVVASDPAGSSNLGNCAGATASSSDEGSFGSGSGGSCYLRFALACTKGTEYVVDLTVSNDTGGVTTASVTVRAD